MIMNNENKRLSGDRERRIERKSRRDDNMKLLKNKIEAEKKKEK